MYVELALTTRRPFSSLTSASLNATRPPPETTCDLHTSIAPALTGARKLTLISALAEKTLRPRAHVTVAAPIAESHMAERKPPWMKPAGFVKRSSARIRHVVLPGSDLSTQTMPRVRSQFGGTCIF